MVRQLIGHALSSIRANRRQPHIVQGYFAMFKFFPVIIEEEFKEYLPEVLNILKRNINTQSESISWLSLQVLGVLIEKYAKEEIDLLLIPVKQSIFSFNQEKRKGSIKLLGDIIEHYEIGGQNYPLEYKECLASLYILKHDRADFVKDHGKIVRLSIPLTFLDLEAPCEGQRGNFTHYSA